MTAQRRYTQFVALALAVAFACLFVHAAAAEDEKAANQKDAWQAITITTGDIKAPYEILGTVAYGDQLTGGIIGDPVLKTVARCEKEMAKQAVKAGATAIIGIQVSFSLGPKEAYLMTYGTAVRVTQ